MAIKKRSESYHQFEMFRKDSAEKQKDRNASRGTQAAAHSDL